MASVHRWQNEAWTLLRRFFVETMRVAAEGTLVANASPEPAIAAGKSAVFAIKGINARLLRANAVMPGAMTRGACRVNVPNVALIQTKMVSAKDS